MSVDAHALDALTTQAFDGRGDNPLNETHALVALAHGEVVLERYASGFDASSTFLSWSMAKSVTSALVGVLVGEGLLDMDAPADVPEWQSPGDARREITLRQLLQMRSGLRWNEDYVDDEVSDVIEMLFGGGKADTAAYAASRPLVHRPGSEWYYSSGTTNIISRLVGRTIGGGVDGFTEALIDGLLRPAGMTTATIKFDDAGTFIGSSFLYATARDYLAFGELFRNDGVAGDGTRLLPEGWVAASVEDHATCPDTGQGYGLQWWLVRDASGSFAANGYHGQRLQISREAGFTFVRLGKTDAVHGDQLREFYAAVASACA